LAESAKQFDAQKPKQAPAFDFMEAMLATDQKLGMQPPVE